MSLIFATQLTAVATAALAVFAIVTAVFAILAFLKQSKEVHDQASMLAIQSEQLAEQRKLNAEQMRVLELQAAELRESLAERKLEAIGRHREQASRVSIALAPAEQATKDAVLCATVTNASHGHQPMYNAKLHWYKGSERYGTPNPEPIGAVPAYERTVRSRHFPAGTDLITCGAFLTFHDPAGCAWMRAPDGSLTEHPPGELDDAAQAVIERRADSPGR